MRTFTADEYWDPLTPEEAKAFERLRDLVRRYLRRTRAFLHDPSARLEIVATMIVVEDAHARINRDADRKTAYASFAEIPESPFENYAEDVRTTYREILPKLIRTEPFMDLFRVPSGCAETIRTRLNTSGEFSPPSQERDQRFWREWWHEAAVELEPGFDEEHFRASLANDARIGIEARADDTAAARAAQSQPRPEETPVSGQESRTTESDPPTSSPPPGQAIAPERIRALDESAPPPPDLRTFNPTKKGPRVTLDATKHILATEIEATHNVPLSTLGRWVNYGRLPTLGRIGKTRVFDRSAFLICKNDWNPRGGNNMRIDAHRCEGA